MCIKKVRVFSQHLLRPCTLPPKTEQILLSSLKQLYTPAGGWVDANGMHLRRGRVFLSVSEPRVGSEGEILGLSPEV